MKGVEWLPSKTQKTAIFYLWLLRLQILRRRKKSNIILYHAATLLYNLHCLTVRDLYNVIGKISISLDTIAVYRDLLRDLSTVPPPLIFG